MASLAAFWQYWRARSTPVPGYRAGLTLHKVLQELRPAWPMQQLGTDGTVKLQAAEGAPAWTLAERVQRHFMMHVVTVELRMQLLSTQVQAHPESAGSSIRLHHRGWRRRTGLAYQLRGPQAASTQTLAERLCADPALCQALQGLDFSRCSLGHNGTAWQLCIEPFGGSEVVSRFPSFRRYVRLGPAQVAALQQAQQALSALCV